MNQVWVYRKTEANLWTVGFYEPNGTWNPESDHDAKESAADCNNCFAKRLLAQIDLAALLAPLTDEEIGDALENMDWDKDCTYRSSKGTIFTAQ